MVEQQSLPRLPPRIQQYLVTLSSSQCQQLCSSEGRQLQSSRHLLVKSVFKVLYSHPECTSLQWYLDKVKQKRDPPKFLFVPEHVFLLFAPTLTICRYKLIHFSPLKISQARRCLLSLVKGNKRVLDELHEMGLSHNDIQLPNICFNTSHEVVLIDVDRYYPLSKLHPMLLGSASGSSCTYCLISPDITLGSQSDYFQLGWLVLWILDKSWDYHARRWEDQKVGAFIKKLV